MKIRTRAISMEEMRQVILRAMDNHNNQPLPHDLPPAGITIDNDLTLAAGPDCAGMGTQDASSAGLLGPTPRRLATRVRGARQNEVAHA